MGIMGTINDMLAIPYISYIQSKRPLHIKLSKTHLKRLFYTVLSHNCFTHDFTTTDKKKSKLD